MKQRLASSWLSTAFLGWTATFSAREQVPCGAAAPPAFSGKPKLPAAAFAVRTISARGARTRGDPPQTWAQAGDFLGGALDTVTASWKEVDDALSTIRIECRAQVKNFAARKANATAVADQKEQAMLRSLVEEAKLKAELDSLSADERQAQASYNAAVKERAAENKVHAEVQETSTQQRSIIGEVLAKLREKQASAPSSRDSGLDTVIGVYSGMLDKVTTQLSANTQEHEGKDKDLAGLLKSYKDALHHVDTQYQAKAVAHAVTQARIQDIKEGMAIRLWITEEEAKIANSFEDICGNVVEDPAAGKIVVAVAKASRIMKNVQHQVEEVLLLMNTLPDPPLTSTRNATGDQFSDAPLLQLRAGRRQRRSEGGPLRVGAWGGRAAKWLLDAAMKGIRELPRAVAVGAAPAQQAVSALASDRNLRRGAQQREDLQELHAFSSAFLLAASSSTFAPTATSSTWAPGDATTGAPADGLAQAQTFIANCAADDMNLTLRISSARQAARAAHTASTVHSERVKALTGMRAMIEAERDYIRGVGDNLSLAFSNCSSIDSNGSFTQDLNDSLSVVADVKTYVDGYIARGDVPRAAGLPIALLGIESAIREMRDQVTIDLRTLLAAYSGILVQCQALKKRCGERDTDLWNSSNVSQAAADQQANIAQQQAQLQQDLDAQRTALEANCQVVPLPASLRNASKVEAKQPSPLTL